MRVKRRLARWLIRLATPVTHREDVLGDLEERHAALARARGERAADEWYWRQGVAALNPQTLLGWAALRGVLEGGNVRQSIRRLAKRPVTSAAVIVLFAVGVGGVGGVFSVFASLLSPRLGIERAEEVSWVLPVDSLGQPSWFVTLEAWDALDGAAVQGVAGVVPAGVTVRVDGPAAEGSAGYVTPGYFEVLGARFARGRAPGPSEVAVVVSDRFWRERMGGDGNAVGSTIQIDRQSYTVAGVTALDFTGAERSDVWLPLEVRAGALRGTGRAQMRVFVRAAAAVAGRAESALGAAIAGVMSGSAGVRLQGISEPASPIERQAVGFGARLLGTLALLVLVGACASAANLLVAEALARRHEFAARLALGASHARLHWMVLTENILLAVAALPLAALSLWAMLRLLPLWLPIGSSAVPMEIRADTLLLCGGVMLVAVLVASLPVLRAANPGVTLRTRAGAQRGSHTMDAMLALQFVQAVVLLSAAGLLFLSLANIRSLPLGFDPADTHVATLRLPANVYDTAAARRFHDAVERRVGAAPGVASVAFTRGVPVIGVAFGEVRTNVEEAGTGATVATVTPTYGEALGMRLERGRWWTEGETGAAVLTGELARALRPEGDALDHEVVVSGTPLRVVGIAVDGTHGGISPARALFRPYNRAQAGTVTVLLRGAGAPAALRNAVLAEDPDVAVTAVGSMDDVLKRAHLLQHGMTQLALLFGALALAICGFGVYAHVSRQASARLREIAVRVALGATPGRAAAVVWRNAARAGVAGGAIGLAGGAAAGFAGSRWFFGVQPLEPVVLGSALLGVLLIGWLAAGVPAMRAARLAPHRSLAGE